MELRPGIVIALLGGAAALGLLIAAVTSSQSAATPVPTPMPPNLLPGSPGRSSTSPVTSFAPPPPSGLGPATAALQTVHPTDFSTLSADQAALAVHRMDLQLTALGYPTPDGDVWATATQWIADHGETPAGLQLGLGPGEAWALGKIDDAYRAGFGLPSYYVT